MQTNWRPVTNDDAGKELVVYHEDLIDLDFNPQGTGIGVVYEDINGGKPYAVIAKWVDMQDCYGFDTVSGPFMVHDKPHAPTTENMEPSSTRMHEMGEQKSMTTHGTMGGLPIIGICDRPAGVEPGPVGEKAPDMEHHMAATGTFIRFHTSESVIHFMDTLKAMTEMVYEKFQTGQHAPSGQEDDT